MSISCSGSLWKYCFDMLKSIGFGDCIRLFSRTKQSDTIYLGWFLWYLVGRLFRMKAARQSVEAHWGAGPIGSSLSTRFQDYHSKCWDQYVSPRCTIWLVFFWVFLPCCCMLIMLLPLLKMDLKSTSLSPGFCVCRQRQYNTICWMLDLISGFFAFSWLIVWRDGINKCVRCPAWGRGWWL